MISILIRVRMAAVFVAALSCIQATAAEPTTVSVDDCLVSLIDKADVPARESGELLEVLAREGASVEPGDLLARIDDVPTRHQLKVAQQELGAARAKAESQHGVKLARAKADVAQSALKRLQDVNRSSPDAVTRSELEQKALEHKAAVLEIDQATLEHELAEWASGAKQAEVESAETAIERRRIVAPIAGQVVEVAKRQGEWVQPGDKVFRILRLDRLRIEGFVPATAVDPAELDGQAVTVTVELARGRRETFEGQVVFVHPTVEASGSFRVWAEVDNRRQGKQWLLRPGLNCRMEIELGGGLPNKGQDDS